MNEMEQELSRLFNAVIGEPPRQVSVHAVRRRAIRRRRLSYVAATAALAVAGSVGVALASVTVPAHQQATGHPLATGRPAYYFEQTPGNGHGVQPVNAIRSTATGTIAGTVECPLPSPYPVFNVAEAATSSGQAFFMACPTATETHPHQVTGTKIYQFTVGRSGNVGGLRLVAGGTLVHQDPLAFAVSADGTEVAAMVYDAHTRAEIVLVINTRSGEHAIWRTGTAPGGGAFSPRTLSFSDGGRELAAFGNTSHSAEMIAVSPAGQGGSFASGRVLFSGNPGIKVPTTAVLGPEGKTVVVAGLEDNGGSRVVLVNAENGKLIGVLLRVRKGEVHQISEDPSGRFVLFVGGFPRTPLNGWISHGKLIPLPGLHELPNTEAW
jgi:DNA-binding beta-propeller fold protein YncE